VSWRFEIWSGLSIVRDPVCVCISVFVYVYVFCLCDGRAQIRRPAAGVEYRGRGGPALPAADQPPRANTTTNCAPRRWRKTNKFLESVSDYWSSVTIRAKGGGVTSGRWPFRLAENQWIGPFRRRAVHLSGAPRSPAGSRAEPRAWVTARKAVVSAHRSHAAEGGTKCWSQTRPAPAARAVCAGVEAAVRLSLLKKFGFILQGALKR